MTPDTEIRLSFKFNVSELNLNTWFAMPLGKKIVSNTWREDVKASFQPYGIEH